MNQASEEPTRQQPLGPGTVTRLVAQKKRSDRVSVFIEGVFAFGLARDLVLEYGLRKGRHLTVVEQQQLIEADEVVRAKSAALAYLASRPRTEHEVRARLQRRGHGEAVAAQVLERLRALGYLDDTAYAQTYVRARFRNRGYGPQRLRSELMRRGVERGLIEAALAEQLEQDDLVESARAQAEKRWARLSREPDSYKRKKKLFDFLLRRGFSYDTVRRVVDELAEA